MHGIVFALVFYPFRDKLFGRNHGWLLMSWMLIGIGILSTFGAAYGSIEGMLYTKMLVHLQLEGWLELIPQAILLSALACYWVNHPKRWLTVPLSILFFVAMALPTFGLLMRPR